MQFHTILTSIALASGLTCAPLAGYAQNNASNPSSPSAFAVTKSPADDLIVEMGQAYKRSDRKRLSALLPQVRGHALEPWAAYWELSVRLDTAGPTEVQEFFTRYANTYQEDRLRVEWLQQAGKIGDWATFSAALAGYRMNDDPDIACYAYALDPSPVPAPAGADIKRQWQNLNDPNDACAQAAKRLLNANLLSEADVWRKARVAIENSRTSTAKQVVALIAPELASGVEEITTSASRYLARRSTAVGNKAKEMTLLAIIRIASADVPTAVTAMERWGTTLTPEQRTWAWAELGRFATQRLSPEALTYFTRARNDDLNDDLLAWKVRAALRQSDWKEVLAATRAMSPVLGSEPAWTYWRARALLQLATSEGSRAEATHALERIAGVRNFYEQLATEELGRKVTQPPAPPVLTATEKEASKQNSGLQRALYAIQLGLRTEGVREWNYTTNLHLRGGMGDRELLAAADLACQHEVWDRCINASERTVNVISFEQRYPMPYRDAVVQRATQIGLDPAYVYGLIRQESRFIVSAQSGVGASGLMQVMPATARWTAKKIGMTDFQPHQISHRDTNIAIGTGYLKLVLDNFGGSMPMAAAAYNAGPNRPRVWRGPDGAPVLEGAIWAETIPFAETRDYVKKVLANATNYAVILSGQPQSLKARLASVGPRDMTGVVDAPDLP